MSGLLELKFYCVLLNQKEDALRELLSPDIKVSIKPLGASAKGLAPSMKLLKKILGMIAQGYIADYYTSAGEVCIQLHSDFPDGSHEINNLHFDLVFGKANKIKNVFVKDFSLEGIDPFTSSDSEAEEETLPPKLETLDIYSK